jgi:hypothetical protein
MTKLSIAALAAVLIAAPVQAQSHDHGAQADTAASHDCPMHQNGAMDHSSDPAHRYMPKMIVRHAEMLKLTADQVAKLESIQSSHMKDCEQHKAGMKAADEAAAKLLEDANPDLAQYEARLRESAEFKVKCRLGMVVAGRDAKALLTAEQLSHLAHMSHAGHQER